MRVSFLIFLLFILSCKGEVSNDLSRYPVLPEEESIDKGKVDSLVGKLYDGFTFRQGGSADYPVIRSLFLPNGGIGLIHDDSLQKLSIDDYILMHKRFVENRDVNALNEIEVWEQTELYGRIAHRMSTFVNYIDSDTISQRGTMSFQLVKIKDDWYINSLIWQVENENYPLPERYWEGVEGSGMLSPEI